MSNVVEIHNSNVFDDISMFLNDLEAKNTKENYKRSIEKFLKWKYGTELCFINERQINKITYTDMKKFREYLKVSHSNSTINNIMYGITSLFKELKRIKRNGVAVYTVDPEELRLKPLKETDTEHWGYVSWQETSQWIDYLKSLPRRQNPERKWVLIHIARITGIRKTGLAKLTYKDLVKENGIWILYSELKGKKHRIPLKDSDAQLLLSLRNDPNDNDELIFKMSVKTMERVLNDIKEHFNIEANRNVVFHSLRGLAAWEAYLSSGKSILAAQNLLGHEDIKTTYVYINKIEDTSNSPTLYMGDELNDELISDLNLDDWNNLYRKLSRSAKYEILSLLSKNASK